MPNLPDRVGRINDRTPRLIQVSWPKEENDQAMVHTHGSLWIVENLDEFGDVEARSIATGRKYLWLRSEYREIKDGTLPA